MDEPAADWWRDYFDERYLEIYRDRLPAEQTRAEVGALIDLLGLPQGARVLDAPCGWGRHAVPLAEAGYAVTGVDLSAVQLRAARAAAREAGVPAAWVRADLRRLPWEGAFDAVLTLFSSLGYWLADEEDLAALHAARSALLPGGCFLLETMHRDALVRSFASRDWYETESGTLVRVERRFDAVEGTNHETLHWQHGAERGEKSHQLRVRSATEWAVLLRAAGLEPVEWLGGWDGEPFDHESERLLVLARPTARGRSGA